MGTPGPDKVNLVASRWQWLEVPGGNDVVRQRPPHAHALLLVDQQAVLLHLDVRLQLLLPPHHVIKLNDVGAGCKGGGVAGGFFGRGRRE